MEACSPEGMAAIGLGIQFIGKGIGVCGVAFAMAWLIRGVFGGI